MLYVFQHGMSIDQPSIRPSNYNDVLSWSSAILVCQGGVPFQIEKKRCHALRRFRLVIVSGCWIMLIKSLDSYTLTVLLSRTGVLHLG